MYRYRNIIGARYDAAIKDEPKYTKAIVLPTGVLFLIKPNIIIIKKITPIIPVFSKNF